jgi:hypothetical protein
MGLFWLDSPLERKLIPTREKKKQTLAAEKGRERFYRLLIQVLGR